MWRAGTKLYIVIILVLVGVACIGSLLLTLLSQANQTPGGNSTSSQDQSSILSSSAANNGLQDPGIAQLYNIAEVKSDDTVAVLNPDTGSEIVINLEHKNWLDPRWSPNSQYVSVLGQTGRTTAKQPIYDLFIYKLSDLQWTQATNFSSSLTEGGISGYSWVGDTTLALTQGLAENNWLHTYDVQNQELKKIFRAAGKLIIFQKGPRRYIFRKDASNPKYADNFTIMSTAGATEFVFTPRDIGAHLNLVSISLGRTDNEYVLQTETSSGKSYWVWSFDDPQFRSFLAIVDDVGKSTSSASISSSLSFTTSPAALNTSYYPACPVDTQTWAVVEGLNGDFVTTLYNVDSNTMTGTQSVNVSSDNPEFLSICRGQRFLLGVKEFKDKGASEINWYLAQSDNTRLKSLPVLHNFTSIDLQYNGT